MSADEQRKKVGSLTRVNQILVGRSPPISVVELQHWLPPSGAHGASVAPDGHHERTSTTTTTTTSGPRSYSERKQCQHHALVNMRARQLLIKTQESALNFLVRWCLLDDDGDGAGAGDGDDDDDKTRSQFTKRRSGHETTRSHHQTDDQQQGCTVLRNRDDRRSRAFVEDLGKLREMKMSALIKYLFRRWFCLVNVIELLLILVLAPCCIYQCYELLDEYYTYPTHIIVKNVMNDNFRTDLPGVTICDNNRLSKSTLMKYFPHLNATHYLAISQGTFQSVDNFTVYKQASSTPQLHEWGLLENVPGSGTAGGVVEPQAQAISTQPPSSNTSTTRPTELEGASSFRQGEINWVHVWRYLTKTKPSRMPYVMPEESIVDSLTCANIAGDIIQCDHLERVVSFQESAKCVTLLHDSALWDPSDPRVRELERNIARRPSSLPMDSHEYVEAEFLETSPEDDLRERIEDELEDARHEERMRVIMDNMEVIRLHIDFRRDDYANPRALISGSMTIHSSSLLGDITHRVYMIEPGNWYTYYIERSDYVRLPPPYSTRCYRYDENQVMWRERVRWLREERHHIYELTKRQAKSDQLIPEYVDTLRLRSMDKRECWRICSYELAAMKCGCWFLGTAYLMAADHPTNVADYNGTLPWCSIESLLQLQAEQKLSSETEGDDLFLQLCSRQYSPLCASACPEECYHSSFEMIQQSRLWPSLESRRHFEDRTIWPRLKKESECCATISIVYTSPASTSLLAEPKYTRQDMLTTISGNIEAWLGVSAVYVYLFFERFYDALIEAQLIRRPAWVHTTTITNADSEQMSHERKLFWRSHYLSSISWTSGCCTGAILGWLTALIRVPISILTQVKIKLTQLFTYLLRQFRRVLCPV